MDVDVKDVSIRAQFCQESAQEFTPIIIRLKRLKGRCAVTIFSRERLCNAKLEGWPEVNSYSSRANKDFFTSKRQK